MFFAGVVTGIGALFVCAIVYDRVQAKKAEKLEKEAAQRAAESENKEVIE